MHCRRNCVQGCRAYDCAMAAWRGLKYFGADAISRHQAMYVAPRYGIDMTTLSWCRLVYDLPLCLPPVPSVNTAQLSSFEFKPTSCTDRTYAPML